MPLTPDWTTKGMGYLSMFNKISKTDTSAIASAVADAIPAVDTNAIATAVAGNLPAGSVKTIIRGAFNSQNGDTVDVQLGKTVNPAKTVILLTGYSHQDYEVNNKSMHKHAWLASVASTYFTIQEGHIVAVQNGEINIYNQMWTFQAIEFY